MDDKVDQKARRIFATVYKYFEAHRRMGGTDDEWNAAAGGMQGAWISLERSEFAADLLAACYKEFERRTQCEGT